jgi:hypothetical protein
MRRPTSRWLLVLVLPLIALSLERTGRADPIQYTSFGDIGNSAGVPIGNFGINATSGWLLGPGTISLASFQAQPLPSGASLTYTNLPFYIDVSFYPHTINSPVDSSALSIQGVLNGTATGASSSNVVATVTSIQTIGQNPLPFSLGSLNVLTPQTLAPSGVDGGTTSLAGQVSSLSIPEPTPLAMMAIPALGAGLRLGIRRIRSRSR